MMIDKQLLFTGQGTSGYAPTAQATNVAPFTIDTAPLGLPTGSGGASTPGYNAGVATNAGRDLGVGGEMWLDVLVTATVTSGGATTGVFELLTDDNAAMTSPVVLVASAAFALATLIAGFEFRVQLPASLVYERYLGLGVLIATADWTAGTVEGKLVMNIQASDLYDTGYLVA